MTRVACAIYTRKSSDEGLEKEFNSLDAQREACEAYITSQKHAGWVAVRDLYDDGGLSGGSMERPALKRLLADIKHGKLQIVVVYKVDRLTRSLADFAKIVDVLDAHGASFVSVTQQFNTTTSMGRLTLNMLLSFAQFEREIAGERIRDKIAASKAKGMWMGGSIPLGYGVKDRKLVINMIEAETVQFIFKRYAELGSVTVLCDELRQSGIVSKRRRDKSGRCSGGRPLTRGALYLMLQNRLYRGEVAHKGKVYRGQQASIVCEDIWQLVQDKLALNRHERSLGVGAENPSLLSGLMVDSNGTRLTPTHANKRGKRYRYYVSGALLDRRHPPTSEALRLPAGEVETLVLDRLHGLLASCDELAGALLPLDLSATALQNAIDIGNQRASRWRNAMPRETAEFVRAVIGSVCIEPAQICISICPMLLTKALGIDSKQTRQIQPLVLTVPATLKRCGKGKRIVVHNGVRDEISPGLVKVLQDAFRAREILLSVSSESLNTIEARLGTSKGRMTSLMRLSYLSPENVRDILAGRQPLGLGAKRLIGLSKDLPLDWLDQRAFLGFGRS